MARGGVDAVRSRRRRYGFGRTSVLDDAGFLWLCVAQQRRANPRVLRYVQQYGQGRAFSATRFAGASAHAVQAPTRRRAVPQFHRVTKWRGAPIPLLFRPVRQYASRFGRWIARAESLIDQMKIDIEHPPASRMFAAPQQTSCAGRQARAWTMAQRWHQHGKEQRVPECNPRREHEHVMKTLVIPVASYLQANRCRRKLVDCQYHPRQPPIGRRPDSRSGTAAISATATTQSPYGPAGLVDHHCCVPTESP